MTPSRLFVFETLSCNNFIIFCFKGQWSKKEDGQPVPPRPTCTNHDDGETNAMIQCSICGNLCADCDRFLHLHRKTRNHQRQVSTNYCYHF